MKLTLPLDKETLKILRIGDTVELTGNLYTARDAAHERMISTLEKGDPLPLNLEGVTIFYAGPCPAKPGEISGPIGPTTSVRMDPYVEPLMKEGVVGMIGKGDRSPYVAELCKEYGAVYFLGIGGAATLYGKTVKEVEIVAYEDLGTESIKRLYVEGLKVIVGIDTKGRVLQDEEIPRYRTRSS